MRIIPKTPPFGGEQMEVLEVAVRRLVNGAHPDVCVTWHSTESFIETHKYQRTQLKNAERQIEKLSKRDVRTRRRLRTYEALAPGIKESAATVESLEDES